MLFVIFQIISIVVSALTAGMFWGPWLALTRSINIFEPEVFLAIGDRMNRSMETLMTVLMPTTLLSTVPVLIMSYHRRPETFYLTVAAFISFVAASIVTVLVEVPIVKQIVTWTVPTLPANWQKLRDRWGAFHVVRVVTGFAGFLALLIGAFYW